MRIDESIPTFRALWRRLFGFISQAGLPSIPRAVASQIAVLSIIALIIFFQEGAPTFSAFLNLGALSLVLCGTFIPMWASRSTTLDRRSVIRMARDRAIAMGGISSLLGTMLMLFSIADVSAVPRRLAFALSGLLYGVILSEIILAPFEEASEDRPMNSRGRIYFAGLFGAVILMCFMTVLYGFSSALREPSGKHAFQKTHILTLKLPRPSFSSHGKKLKSEFRGKLDVVIPTLKSLEGTHPEFYLFGELEGLKAGWSELAIARLTSVANYFQSQGINIHAQGCLPRGCLPGDNTADDIDSLSIRIYGDASRGCIVR